MPSIPAVCNTCGDIFPSPFGGYAADDITFEGCTCQCPSCGATADVLDGTYSFLEDAIRIIAAPKRTLAELRRLETLLRAAKERRYSIGEIGAALRQEMGEVRSLADLRPRVRQDYYTTIMALLALVGVVITAKQCGKEPHVEVTEIITKVYEGQVITPSPAPSDTILASDSTSEATPD
jgi:hypothetical protein